MPKAKHRKTSHRRTHSPAGGRGRHRATSAQDGDAPFAPLAIEPIPAIPAFDGTDVVVNDEWTGVSSDYDDPESHTNAQNVTLLKEGDLTPRQLAAIPYVVSAPSNAQAARKAGINRRTLYRWLDDPDFRAELTRLREESAAFARSETQGVMPHVLSVLLECTQSKNDFVRYCASRYLYNAALQVGEFEKLRAKLQDLENVLQP